MSSALLTLFSNLPSVAAMAGAILLALEGHGSWVWFLAAAVLLAAGPVLHQHRDSRSSAERDYPTGAAG